MTARCSKTNSPNSSACSWVAPSRCIPKRPQLCLSPHVIWLPRFDQLLDGLALFHLFVQYFARQLRQLRVACKAQRDALAHGKSRETRAKVRRQEALVTQPLFQTDQTVLHRQHHQAHAEKSD